MHAPTHVKCTVHSEKSRTHGADTAQVPEMELGRQVVCVCVCDSWDAHSHSVA